MAHHRNAAQGQIFDGGGHGRAAFDLHPLGAGFLHHSRGAGIGLLGRALIGSERQVDHHHGPARAAHHCLGVQDHHVQGDAHRIGQAVQHHADRVADQQHVARLVEQLRHGRGIGRQADDRLAALARGDIRGRQAADLILGLG